MTADVVLVYVILLLVAALLAICGCCCCCLPYFKPTIRWLVEILRGLPNPYNSALVAVVSVMVSTMVFSCFWMIDPTLQDLDVYSQIVRGCCPELAEQPYCLNRTKERAVLQKAILNADKGFYYVITGPHGCGKSFLVQETVLELMTNSTPVPGLLYLHAKGSYPIAGVIGDVLVENRNRLLAAIQQIARVTNLYSLPDDPMQGMEKLCDKLDQLGLKFRKEYGRPIVIVVDDVNKLIKFEDHGGQFKLLDTMLLDNLQDCARHVANSGSVRFMFIDSAGVALQRLQQRTGAKTRMSEIRIPDVSKEQAKDFLQQRLSKTNMSVDKIYEQLTGGRLILLHKVIDLVVREKLKTFEDLYNSIIAETKFGSLQPCGLNVKKSKAGKGSKEDLMRSTVITEMFKNGGQLATEDLNTLVKDGTSLTWKEVIDLMVKKDILMFVNGGEVVKFHSVAIETAFKELGY